MGFVEFTVNGEKCVVTSSIPRETSLNAYIRYCLCLPGTKAMCREGGCGSCIVSVRARRLPSGTIETFSVNSCLVLVFSCHGWEITTIEGLGSRLDGYGEIQKRVAAFNATQCGYCTPGWVMHLSSIKDKNLKMNEMERAFGSNTCRCTGFRPILDTAKSFAVDASPHLRHKVQDMEDINKVCIKTNKSCDRKCSFDDEDWCVVNDANVQEHVMIKLDFGDRHFFKVYDENEIFDVLKKFGDDSYIFVDGNTAKGIEENFEYPRVLIDISEVKSLKQYRFDQNLIIGANVSLEDCIRIFQDIAKSRNDEFAYLAEFAKHLDLVAHIPIRKIGSIAGNLMTKHKMPVFPSDVFLLLTAVRADVTVRDSDGIRTTLSMLHFLRYDMQGKLMVNVELPPLSKTHVFRSYKIMPRSQNALAIVNAAFLLNIKNEIVDEISIVYGNITENFNHATETECFLKGKKVFTNETLQSAIKTLNTELNPVERPPEPSADCRKKLAIGVFYKFLLNISPPDIIAPRIRSGGYLLTRPVSKGSQDYQTDSSLYPLNQPVPKYEALIQAAGEAEYANDVPPLPRQVFGAFVLSTVYKGAVDEVSLDILKIPGVVAVYTAKDIPGKNSFAHPGIQLQTRDEVILASSDIQYYGQPVAIVVAESEDLASAITKKVKVTYKNVSTLSPVLTIDEAKKDSKRYSPGGDDAIITPKSKGSNVSKVIKGVYEVGAAYHYYLEPLTTVVKPVDQCLEVYDTTQWADLTQIAIAQCLGINESRIIVKVRRVGGAFGGKISRNVQVATACALVASKLSRPCRFILPMQTNLTIAGSRGSSQCDYEVGVDDDGKIQYLNATIVEDHGCTNNEDFLSFIIGGFANCYNTDTFNFKTAFVVTDKATNTYFRAPGTAEGMASIEHIMERIAFELKKDINDVRLANMRTDDNDLPKLIEEFKKETDYNKRFKEIEQFNEVNRWNKKALNISVMSFPVVYFGNYAAMVSVYRGDGTVTVTSGGVEMGQGVNTKAAQVCAYELGIPLDYVTVLPLYSFVAANSVFSGASIVSESVCYAIIKACAILKERLKPIREKLTNPTWKVLIETAGKDQIDLTATYMMDEKEKDLSGYNAYAVVVLETELDVLTGRFEARRVDILEDVGLSVNPHVDIGQIEGAYVQGLGYYTTEKLVHDKTTGKLLTNRSLNYHVPLCLDIPADFRIKLRYNSKNTTGVLGAKAVGEMGLCSAYGIKHVLRQCVLESRKESGYDPEEWIDISIPMDTESILKALDVKLDEMVFHSSNKLGSR